MKKYIIKKALIPVVQVVLDDSVIDTIESINFRIDGNRITNKISSIHFKVCADSFVVMKKLINVFRLNPRHIIENKALVPVGIDLCSKQIYLVKDDTIELREEVIILEEI